MARIAPRRPTPESLGDYSVSRGHALALASVAAIGIGNAIVLRRARSDSAGGPTTELRDVLDEPRNLAARGSVCVVGETMRMASQRPGGWRIVNLRTPPLQIIKKSLRS